MSNRRKLRNPGRYEQPSTAMPVLGWSTLAAANTRASQILRLRESDTAVLDAPPEQVTTPPAPVSLTETSTRVLAEAAGADGSHQLVQIISAGWGSSGHYSESLLRHCAESKVFGKGLHLYVDHPSVSEEHDRPERSVRDIAGVLAEDARYDPTRQALVGKVRVMPHYRELLTNLAEDVGLSIRADGIAEHGEAEGRTGPIVKEITNALSCDYVTKAGRGGKVLALLESAREATLQEARNVGAWLESRLHLELTRIADDMYGDGKLTREERIALSGAIGDGLTAYTARVVADAPQLFQRDLWQDPDQPEQPVVVAEAISTSDLNEPEPAPGPAATGTPTDTAPVDETPTRKEPAMSGTETGAPPVAGTAPVAESANTNSLSHEARAQIAESQLQAAQARITVLEGERASLTVERDTARGEVRRIRNVESARTAVGAALGAVQDLPQAARTRIAESLTATPPTTEAGEVDTAALTAAVTRAVEAEQAYIASIRESAGAGTVSGLGGTSAPQDAAAWQSDIQSRFARLGHDDKTAALAARR